MMPTQYMIAEGPRVAILKKISICRTDSVHAESDTVGKSGKKCGTDAGKVKFKENESFIDGFLYDMLDG